MSENFETSWERVKEALKIKRQKELSEKLGLSQSAITEGKKGKKFPEKWAKALEDKYGISADWILKGNVPKFKRNFDAQMAFYEELEQWARETGKSENTQWLKNQIESFFPMFVQWKKRREEGGIKENDEPRSRVA